MNHTITILCIDDEEQICFALGALFRLQGWQTLTALSVEEGLRKFQQSRPDLVLIDYHMPQVNGLDGVKLLRRRSATVPIIVFTIDEEQEVADAFLRSGANDFALKPIKAPDLISRMKLHLRLLEQSSHERPAKGVSPATLSLIEDLLQERGEALTANEIAQATGLAYQTVYRYLQTLVSQGRVEMHTHYGKVGRPKQSYSRSAE